MKKTFRKALSVFLAMLMCLTAVPAIALAADEQTTPASPVFEFNLKSETADKVIVSLTLTEGSFNCLDLAISACEHLSLEKIELNIEIFMPENGLDNGSGSSNIANGMISFARPDAFTPDFEFVTYTFQKLEDEGVTADDFNIEVIACGIDSGVAEPPSIDITDSVTLKNNLPTVHVHEATGDWKTIVEPACDKEGEKVRYCGICGEVAESETIAVTEHKNIVTDSKDPTCTEAGYEKEICGDCGKLIKETTYEPTNHPDTRTEHKDSTCSEKGYDRVICNDCGKTIREDILDFSEHLNRRTLYKEATCTEEGYEKVICVDCGATLSETIIDAKGHGEKVTQRLLPTCTENGYIRETCKDCGETVKETILEAKGHRYITDIKNPTCTEDGYVQSICPACQDVASFVSQPHTGHSWLEWTVIQQPTYSKAGVERRICNTCGIDEERPVPKLVATPTELKLEMQEIGMNFRQTTRLFVNVLPEEAAYSTEIIWESSNPEVATVDETGAVYAVAPGTATITARTADGSLSVTCEVTVQYSILQWIIIYILFGWIWYV